MDVSRKVRSCNQMAKDNEGRARRHNKKTEQENGRKGSGAMERRGEEERGGERRGGRGYSFCLPGFCRKMMGYYLILSLRESLYLILYEPGVDWRLTRVRTSINPHL